MSYAQASHGCEVDFCISTCEKEEDLQVGEKWTPDFRVRLPTGLGLSEITLEKATTQTSVCVVKA